ncbi:MAG: MOSC domain-containing protein [Candidatus Heimdallarchaeota archaeon]
MAGYISQINIKTRTLGERGLPKYPVETARLTKKGLEGDFNVYRTKRKNNDPSQAVLIMPIEMIHTLNQEGWPIKSGDLGENFTTKGIEYDEFQPGDQFNIGETIIEITKGCNPCRNLSVLPYVTEKKVSKFIQFMLNRRGWYGKVVREGIVKKGDDIQKL